MRKHLLPFIIGIVCIVVPCISRGSDFQQQQSTLYPYQSSIFLQEEFLTGSQTTGSIGSLGWTSGGTVIVTAGNSGNPGLVRVETGAVSGTIARIFFNGSNVFNTSLPHRTTWITRLNTNDANTTLRVGLSAGSGSNPPTDGYYFEKLDADTNWFCVTRSAGVQTRTDTGVAVTLTFVKFEYGRVSGRAEFRLNNSLVCTHTTNLSSVESAANVQIVNSAAANKTVTVDYFQFIVTGLAR